MTTDCADDASTAQEILSPHSLLLWRVVVAPLPAPHQSPTPLPPSPPQGERAAASRP